MTASTKTYALFAAVLLAAFVQHNPLLFGRSVVDHDNSSYEVIASNPVLDHHLGIFRRDIGDDYVPYRNHCLRVLTFAKYRCGEHCGPREVDLMAMALAYHDIGLWSDGAMNYLGPSARQMHAHANDGEHNWTDEELATANEIVLQHHKLTTWTGGAGDATLVNSVRKADWADATLGTIRYSLPASLLEAAYARIPEAGFHGVLAGMGGRLSPNSIGGQLAVLRIFKL